MVGILYPNASGFGGLTPETPESTTQAVGLQNISADPRLEDLAARQAQLRSDFAQRMQVAPPPEQPTPKIAYSPSTRKMAVNGRVFDAADVTSARAASQFLDQPGAEPPTDVAADWTYLTPDGYGQYLQALAAPRSTMEDLALGARGVAEGLVGGVGRGLEMAGATTAGPAIAQFAEGAFGQSDYEKARSAYIQEQNSLWQNIQDATIQGAPSLATSIGAFAAGSAVAGPVGGLVGTILSILPQELKASYDAAAQNYDVNDPGVRSQIVGAALAKTLPEAIIPGIAGKALSAPVRETIERVAKDVAARGMTRVVGGAVVTGAPIEGLSEAFSETLDSVLFDPEVRSKFTANDWKALVPYITNKYGEQAVIAFGAGAFLGGGVTGATKYLEASRASDLLNKPKPTAALTPEQQQIEDLRKTFGTIPPDLFGGFLPTQTAPLDASRMTAAIPPPQPVGEQLNLPLQPAAPPAATMPALTSATAPPVTTGLPLFDVAPINRVAPGETYPLFENLPTQVPPVAPTVPPLSQPQQMELPLEGVQLELPSPGGVPAVIPTGPVNLKRGRGRAPSPPTEEPIVTPPPGTPPSASPGAAALQRGRIPPSARGRAPIRRGDLRLLEIEKDFYNTAMQAGADKVAAMRSSREFNAAPEEPIITPPPPSAAALGRDKKKPTSAVLSMTQKEKGSSEYLVTLADGRTATVSRTKVGWELDHPGVYEPISGLANPDFSFLGKTKKEAIANIAEKLTQAEANTQTASGQKAVLARYKLLSVAQKTEVARALGLASLDDVMAAGGIKSAAQKPQVDPQANLPVWEEQIKARLKTDPAPVVQAIDAILKGEPTPPKGTKPTLRAPTRQQVEVLSERTPTADPGAARSWFKELGTLRNKFLADSGYGDVKGFNDAVDTNFADVQEKINAFEARQVAEGDQRQYQEDRGRMEGGRDNRNLAPEDQAAGRAAGRGNLAPKSRAEAKRDKIELRDNIATVQDENADYTEREDALTAIFEFTTSRNNKGERDRATEAETFLNGYQETGTPLFRKALFRALGDNSQSVNKYLQKVPRDVEEASEQGKYGTAMPTSVAEVLSIIKEINELGFETAEAIGPIRERLVTAWRQAKKNHADFLVGEKKLSDFFRGDKPNFFRRADDTVEVRPPQKPGEPRAFFSLSDWNTIDGTVDDNGRPVKPLPVGRLKLLVNNFKTKLAVQPKTHVYGNQADLKRTNPDLYQQAVAAREGDDFDTAKAAGYYFIDKAGQANIIIFSENIAGERHLNFVLTHEVFGHFGLRGIIPANQYNALMRQIYDADARVRGAVDAAMSSRNMKLEEAVEEYLSDYAAVLDRSLVRRVYNAIKAALNKLGLRFGDEMTRYLLSQAGRYVREGKPSAMFDAQAVGQRLAAVEYGTAGSGHFAREGNLVTENHRVAQLLEGVNDFPVSATELWNQAKRLGMEMPNSFDEFKRKVLSLSNYSARVNAGLRAFDDLMSETREKAMRIKVRYNEFLAPMYSATFRIPGTNVEWGMMSKADRDASSRLHYYGRDLALSKIRDGFDFVGKDRLVQIDTTGQPYINRAELKRLYEHSLISFAEAKNGFKVKYPDADGKMVEIDVPGIPNLTKDSLVWTNYLLGRKAMSEIEADLLVAKYSELLDIKDTLTDELTLSLRNGDFTAADDKFVTDVKDRFVNLYNRNRTVSGDGKVTPDPEMMNNAEKFIAKVNELLIADRTDKIDQLYNAPFTDWFERGEIDDLANSIRSMRDRLLIADTNKFDLQANLRQWALAEISAADGERNTKQSIASGYIPVIRSGKYESRLQAMENGRPVELQGNYKTLLTYSRFDNEQDAKQFSSEMGKTLEGVEFKVKVRDLNDPTGYRDATVTLVPEYRRALTALAAPPELNLNEFVRGLRQFGVQLPPDRMQAVITALTRTNDAAIRKQLQYSQTQGFDRTQAVEAISQHIDMRASTIARITTAQRLNRLMNLRLPSTQKSWNGDADRVVAAKQAMDAAMADPKMSPEAKASAKHTFDTELYMYRETNPGHKFWDGSADKLSEVLATPSGGKGMQYYDEASNTLSFLNGNKYVDESDFGASDAASVIRTWTGMVQLGGSIANGALNLLSVETNLLPYLATYNQRTAFGGGFGYARSQTAIATAFKTVGMPKGKYITADYFDTVAQEIAANPAAGKKYQLNAYEARALADAARKGITTPAQFNALVNTARGRMSMGGKVTDYFMAPFTWTEAAARRASFLASYRLAYDQALESGKSAVEANKIAQNFAEHALKLTLGEYSVLNRPPAWRGGIQSFAYMYKAYPTTVVQLIANLDRKGQLGMLAALWLLSGLAGLPFAEDAEDAYDTAVQTLGLQQASVRANITKLLDEVFPGMSPYIMRGFMNSFLGGTVDVAGRTSMGDLLPGTGIALAGANTWEEVKDIIGPAAGMLGGLPTFMKQLLTAPFSTTQTVEDAFRNSPVTVMRLLGDTSAYYNTGAIVDKRGAVVSDEMNYGVLLGRLLGFYPENAAAQYGGVKYIKRINDYRRETTLAYRKEWVKAKMRKDNDRMKDISEAVREWNRTAKGTPYEIKDFEKNSMRAYKELNRPVGERALRATPLAQRKQLEDVLILMTD